MAIEALIKEARKKIGTNEVGSSIELLLQWTEENSLPDVYDQVLQLKRRWAKHKEDSVSGLLSDEDLGIASNRIVKSVLAIISDLKSPSQLKSPMLGKGVYLLCNRNPQVEFIEDIVYPILDDDQHRPFLFFIHGNPEERHSSLIERFIRFDFQHLVKNVTGIAKNVVKPYEIKRWPIGNNIETRKAKIKRRIAEAIDGVEGKDWTPETLIDKHRKWKVVLLQHNIAADHWDGDTIGLLDWLISDFWNVNIGTNRPLVILFVNVFYDKQEKGFFGRLFSSNPNDKIREDLNGLKNKFKDRCFVLDQLRPVRKNDVDIWIEDNNLHEIRSKIEHLFQNTDAEISMNVIEDTFKVAVEELRKQRDRAILVDN